MAKRKKKICRPLVEPRPLGRRPPAKRTRKNPRSLRRDAAPERSGSRAPGTGNARQHLVHRHGLGDCILVRLNQRDSEQNSKFSSTAASRWPRRMRPQR